MISERSFGKQCLNFFDRYLLQHMNKNIVPPKWPLKLLRLFLKDHYLEEIEGDMEERFHDNYRVYSLRKARRLYAWETLKLIRPILVRSFNAINSFDQTDMIRHNLFITLRTFKRYKTSFFINLIGLSTGLTCALLVFLWVNDEYAIDKFHEKSDRLYQVLEIRKGSEGYGVTNETSGPMAELIKEIMPEVEYAAAVAPTWWHGHDNFTVSFDQRNVRAIGQYAGADFFNIFSYNLLQGKEDNVLADKNSIVISEELALKLFETVENAMGMIIKVNHEYEYIVSGIFENTPTHSTSQFDMVMPFEKVKELIPWVTSWGSSGPVVYAALIEGTNIESFNEKFESQLKMRFGDTSKRSAFLRKYSDIYLFGMSENEAQRIRSVRLFSIIAMFILLIACINFMNLSTARASRRFKEVGIKKVVGAVRRSLILQFMGEAIINALFSLMLSVLFVVLFLPEFNHITGKQLSLNPSSQLLQYAFFITLGTGIVAGSYPALYLSRFRPIHLLKGSLNTSTGEAWIRQGLVIFQFSISILMIVCVLVVYRQIDFVQNEDIGYAKENVMWFSLEGKLKDNTDVFVNELKEIPGVENAATTFHRMVGHNWSSGDLKWGGKDPEDRTGFQIFAVNYGFIEMMNFEFVAGRPFSSEYGADDRKIIFNERAIEAMGIEDPLGETVELFGEKQIVGVVKDFHFQSMHEKVQPSLFILAQEGLSMVMVRIEEGRENEVISEIGKYYESFNPGFTFNYQFLEDNYQSQYQSERQVSTLSLYFTLIAILISCLGLFGMAAFTAERRLKEIGIRKILGAGDLRIVRLVAEQFTKMVFVAIIIALPLSYLIAEKWLESFAYRISLSWWFFAVAGFAALIITWLTIGTQIIKIVRINLVDCLRDE